VIMLGWRRAGLVLGWFLFVLAVDLLPAAAGIALLRVLGCCLARLLPRADI